MSHLLISGRPFWLPFIFLVLFNLPSFNNSQATCPGGGAIRSCSVGTCITVDASQHQYTCLCPSGYAPTGSPDTRCQGQVKTHLSVHVYVLVILVFSLSLLFT